MCDKIAIIDSQLQSGRGADLLHELPQEIIDARLPVMTRSELADILDMRDPKVCLVLLHLSGVDNPNQVLSRLLKTYNNDDISLMATEKGVPIIVTSGDPMLLLTPRAKGYQAWLRSEWRDNARDAGTVAKILEKARGCYGGEIALRDAHRVCRTIFALYWRLAEPSKPWSSFEIHELLDLATCQAIINTLTEDQVVNNLAENCFRAGGTFISASDAFKAIASAKTMQSKDYTLAINNLTSLLSRFSEAIKPGQKLD